MINLKNGKRDREQVITKMRRSFGVVPLIGLSALLMASFEAFVSDAYLAARELRAGGFKCSDNDIAIEQGPSGHLPNGIPLYTAHIANVNPFGSSISDIHIKCGWFSSAVLINPKIFKRLRQDDCLVNDGEPMASGSIIEFQYANSFSYPLSVLSANCSA